MLYQTYTNQNGQKSEVVDEISIVPDETNPNDAIVETNLIGPEGTLQPYKIIGFRDALDAERNIINNRVEAFGFSIDLTEVPATTPNKDNIIGIVEFLDITGQPVKIDPIYLKGDADYLPISGKVQANPVANPTSIPRPPTESPATPTEAAPSSPYSTNIMFYDGRPVPSKDISALTKDLNLITDQFIKAEIIKITDKFPAVLGNDVSFTQDGYISIKNTANDFEALGYVMQGIPNGSTNTIFVTRKHYENQTGTQEKSENVIELPNFAGNPKLNEPTLINSRLAHMYNLSAAGIEIKPDVIDPSLLQPTHVTTFIGTHEEEATFKLISQNLVEPAFLRLSVFRLSFVENGPNDFLLVNLVNKQNGFPVHNGSQNTDLFLSDYVAPIIRYPPLGLMVRICNMHYEKPKHPSLPLYDRAYGEIALSPLGIDTKLRRTIFENVVDDTFINGKSTTYEDSLKERSLNVSQLIRLNTNTDQSP